MIQQQQELNHPIDINDENDCDLSLLEPFPLDCSMPNSSVDLFRGFMMDDIFSSSPKIIKQQRRRVTFQDKPPAVKLIQSFACFDEYQRQELWYRPVEIEHFRSNIRSVCRELRHNPMAYPLEMIRGLELRTSLDRQWRKHLTVTCIVKAQARYPNINPCHLAEIAQSCTELPREESSAQGVRDFCTVYHPTMESPVKALPPMPLKVSRMASAVAESAVKYQCRSRLQKRSSPQVPSCRSEEAEPPAKRHCSILQFEQPSY